MKRLEPIYHTPTRFDNAYFLQRFSHGRITVENVHIRHVLLEIRKTFLTCA